MKDENFRARIDNIISICYNHSWVRVHGLRKLEEFAKKHRDAQSRLDTWVDIMQSCAYQSFADLRGTFPNADYDKPYTIFNIGGNKYRVIAVVDYSIQIVLINSVMTHAEYDRWNRKGKNRRK